QTATVITTVTPPAVIVKDQFGNPVAGAAVTFAIASGQGGITGAAQTTNASGIATVGSWTLGRAAGTNTLTATSTGLNGSPVTFTATGTAGAAASVAVSAGNNQAAAVGTAVATPPAVIVQDQFNNPVAGVAVTFAPAAGSGSVRPTTPILTNASGVAALTSWTLGTTARSNSLTETSAGLTGSPVAFPPTGTAGAASEMALNAGNDQVATVGTAGTTAPSVIMRDHFANPVPGV